MYNSDSNPYPLIILYQPYDSLREGLETILGDRYRVTSVRSLPELPRLLESELPALLIIDADDSTGVYDVLTGVHAAHKDLRILLLACKFSLDQQIQAVRLLEGTAAFLTKPFSNDYLLEKVQTLVHGHSDSPIRHRIVRIAL